VRAYVPALQDNGMLATLNISPGTATRMRIAPRLPTIRVDYARSILVELVPFLRIDRRAQV